MHYITVVVVAGCFGLFAFDFVCSSVLAIDQVLGRFGYCVFPWEKYCFKGVSGMLCRKQEE